MNKNTIMLSNTEMWTPAPDEVLESKEFRTRIMELEKLVSNLPNALHGNCFPLEHSFAEGVYIRTISIPQGFFCIGKLHKTSYVNLILSGEMAVVTEEGFQRIRGPLKLISPANIKRFGYSYSTCVWVTVHPNPDNCTDIKVLEERIHLDSYPDIVVSEVSSSTLEAFESFQQYIKDTKISFDVALFRELSLEIFSKERTSYWSDWTKEEQDFYVRGDWKSFSHSRGYTEEDIESLHRWIDLYEKAISLKINPFTYISDITARVCARNIALDTRGEIEMSTKLPSNDFYKELKQ